MSSPTCGSVAVLRVDASIADSYESAYDALKQRWDEIRAVDPAIPPLVILPPGADMMILNSSHGALLANMIERGCIDADEFRVKPTAPPAV